MRISLALSQRALTSLSLRYSQRLRRSIWSSRSLIDTITLTLAARWRLKELPAPLLMNEGL